MCIERLKKNPQNPKRPTKVKNNNDNINNPTKTCQARFTDHRGSGSLRNSNSAGENEL